MCYVCPAPLYACVKLVVRLFHLRPVSGNMWSSVQQKQTKGPEVSKTTVSVLFVRVFQNVHRFNCNWSHSKWLIEYVLHAYKPNMTLTSPDNEQIRKILVGH